MPERTTTVATYASSGAAVAAGGGPLIFGMQPSEIGAYCAIGGFVVGLITFFVNLYYKRKKDRREEMNSRIERRIFEGKK